jgi:hypothetical protein
MERRDLIGVAAGVMIALLTQIVTPWSICYRSIVPASEMEAHHA